MPDCGPQAPVLSVDVCPLQATQTLEEGQPSSRRRGTEVEHRSGGGGHEVPVSLPWTWDFVRSSQGQCRWAQGPKHPHCLSGQPPLSPQNPPLQATAHSQLVLPHPPCTPACLLISALLESTSARPRELPSTSQARGSISKLKTQLHFDYSSPSQTEVTVSHIGIGRNRG